MAFLLHDVTNAIANYESANATSKLLALKAKFTKPLQGQHSDQAGPANSVKSLTAENTPTSSASFASGAYLVSISSAAKEKADSSNSKPEV